MGKGGSPYIMVQGVLVERDALQVAEAVNDYDPNLHIQFLEQASNIGEPPFRVVETCRDGFTRIVFSCWELDGRVLDRIRAADTHKQNIQHRIEDTNRRAKNVEVQRYKESMAEAHELSQAILRSPKDTYTVGNKKFKA